MATATAENGSVLKGPTRQPTTVEVNEQVKKYNFFNPKLRQQANENGDIYDREQVERSRSAWHVTSAPGERPYLTHVKSLAAGWPQLGLLADFMEIGTSPVRWKDLNTKDKAGERAERISRTKVTRLDYFDSGKPKKTSYSTPKALKDALTAKDPAKAVNRNFRLFVVEDLSRDVIENLGSRYDIEPQFFREHIFDYTWHNTRDRWVDPPKLGAVTKQQAWFQMRFATARYFRTALDFKDGFDETQLFNVLRRPDDDLNTRDNWDQRDAKVGLSRTRTSFWMKNEGEDGAVGILLVDPTIRKGFPLWYGYGNWEKTPSMHTSEYPAAPPRKSFYEDAIYWAQKIPISQSTQNQCPHSSSARNPNANFHVPIIALLHLVSSEWLIMSEYIKTRLGQIEWEISYPQHFLNKEDTIDVALNKLHVWRRLVPLYREMLSETLQRVFEFPCHTLTAPSLIDADHTATGTTIMAQTATPPGLPVSPNQTQPPAQIQNQAPVAHQTCQCPLHNPSNTTGPISEMRADFARILSYMEEYQQRIDRLTSVVTAIISIQDSRTSQADNRNVARLTWLATFFIPMSFVTGLFSMVEDIGTLDQTIKWYLAVALPLSVISLGMAVVLTLPGVLRWWGRWLNRFQRIWDGDMKKKNL